MSTFLVNAVSSDGLDIIYVTELQQAPRKPNPDPAYVLSHHLNVFESPRGCRFKLLYKFMHVCFDHDVQTGNNKAEPEVLLESNKSVNAIQTHHG